MDGPIKLTNCHNMGGNQHFTVFPDRTIVINHQCVQAPVLSGPITTGVCAEHNVHQKLEYSKEVSIFGKYEQHLSTNSFL